MRKSHLFASCAKDKDLIMINVGVHLRDTKGFRQLDKICEHIRGLIGSSWELSRIYTGDEFCVNRLPSLTELNKVCELAEDRNLELTFLIPYLTDWGQETCSRLLDALYKKNPSTEVVVNDWGTLVYVQNKYPSFKLALGRLLNKGFKDPRLQNVDDVFLLSEELAELLNTGTFDSVELQNSAKVFGFSRMERDLFPYEKHDQKAVSEIKLSYYFPFGYITTGRVCLLSSLEAPKNRKFTIQDRCTQPCNKLHLRMKSKEIPFEIFQGGNTVFYLYTKPMLELLVTRAELDKARLVYQGQAIP